MPCVGWFLLNKFGQDAPGPPGAGAVGHAQGLAPCHDLGKGTTPAEVLPRHIGHEERSVRLLRGVGERLRVPVDCRELAEVVAREHGNIHRSLDLGAEALLRLLERCDALRKPARFAQALLACECDARTLGAARPRLPAGAPAAGRA